MTQLGIVIVASPAPSGITSASSSYVSNPPWKAFDGASGAWNSAIGTAYNNTGWIAYEFATAQIITSYTMTCMVQDSPTDWTFQGWNGSTWTTLDTQVGDYWGGSIGQNGSSLTQTFTFVNATAYIKYRIYITKTNIVNNYVWIRGLRFNVASTLNNITLPSTAVTAVAQPTSASMIVFEEDVDAVTLNTDLVAAVSRDGGTTWTNCTLVDKGNIKTTVTPATSSLETTTFIPVMTGNTSPSGVASASSTFSLSFAPWKAFNQSIGNLNNWGTASGQTTGWLAYDFVTSVVIGKYSIQAESANSGFTSGATAAPKTWTFEGWDGSAWVTLDTQTNVAIWATDEVRFYAISNTVAYTKYRINVTLNQGRTDVLAIGNMGMYRRVSTPGSTTYQRILQGTADISTQPAGTSMKYKLTTANAKNLKLHGTALNWK